MLPTASYVLCVVCVCCVGSGGPFYNSKEFFFFSDMFMLFVTTLLWEVAHAGELFFYTEDDSAITSPQVQGGCGRRLTLCD